jgi:hypothetical protein
MAGAYKIVITYDTFQINIKFFLFYPDNENIEVQNQRQIRLAASAVFDGLTIVK